MLGDGIAAPPRQMPSQTGSKAFIGLADVNGFAVVIVEGVNAAQWLPFRL